MTSRNPLPGDRRYSRREERLNVLTHGGGVLLALGGLVWLLHVSAGNAVRIAAGSIYAATLILVYLSSMCYHASRRPRLRAGLRMLDHSAIYLLIAGTYTPILLQVVGGRAGWWWLAVVWGLAAVGIVLKVIDLHRFRRTAIALSLTMGWCCLCFFDRLLADMPGGALALLVAGGAAYSLGIVFFLDRREYRHAVWHLWVLAGSVLQFFSILLLP